MDTGSLKKFAQAARRMLREQVSAKLAQVLKTDSPELRQRAKTVKELQEKINHTSKEVVIDRVAYIWFNRFSPIFSCWKRSRLNRAN